MAFTAAMQMTDIADALNRFEWEALRALTSPNPNHKSIPKAAIGELLQSELIELRADSPSLTAKGRKVVICGSPRLWNS